MTDGTKTFDPVEFLAFVKGKPGDQRYDAGEPDKCALAQFGFSHVWGENMQGVPDSVYSAALDRPFTFGALASRLEVLLAEQGEG